MENKSEKDKIRCEAKLIREYRELSEQLKTPVICADTEDDIV